MSAADDHGGLGGGAGFDSEFGSSDAGSLYGGKSAVQFADGQGGAVAGRSAGGHEDDFAAEKAKIEEYNRAKKAQFERQQAEGAIQGPKAGGGMGKKGSSDSDSDTGPPPKSAGGAGGN